MHLQGCFKENINHMKARWLFLERYAQVKFIFQCKRRHQLLSGCIRDLFEISEIAKLFHILIKYQ